MSKAWDKLRTPPVVLPIRPGAWQGGGPRIEYVGSVHEAFPNGDVRLRFGYESNSPVRFSSAGLRELAEFATELADQLDA